MIKVTNHGTVTEDLELQAINNSLYWSILQAIIFGQLKNRVNMHESFAFGQPSGNGSCQSLVGWSETKEPDKLTDLSIERSINNLQYTDSDSQTVGGSYIYLVALVMNILSMLYRPFTLQNVS